jgi:thiol:disulfide interchange protein DsbD
VPEHFVQGGIGNYGYAGSADLLVPISVAQEVATGGTAVLSAEASWLVCAEICIPGSAKLSLSLPIVAGPVASDPARAELFAAVRRQLPLSAAFETRFVSGADDYRLLVPEAALAGLRSPTGTFFPNDGSLIDHAAEPRASRGNDGLEITLKKANPRAAMPATLDGVVALRGADGAQRAFEISANPAAGLPTENGLAWWQALLLALLGGIVLNAMPCVFPILSLKLLGLARQAHGHRSEQVAHGLAYTA